MPMVGTRMGAPEMNAAIMPAEGASFEVRCDVLVIGAGAAGLVTALRAREAGCEVLVIERDAVPRGSTSLSAGLIPAAGTRFQREAGVTDNAGSFVADIMAKAHEEPDPAQVQRVVSVAGEVLEWLADAHGLPFSVITNFTYPGHSNLRMHGLPSRSGAELMDRLRAAAEGAGVDIVTEARASALLCEGRLVAGVEIARPDGTRDRIGCETLVLASNGYGGAKDLVAAEIPPMAGALYFGHAGNQGEALVWGRALGAATRHLSGHQGHGSVAHPHGILTTWATNVEGGYQVNLAGERFANEASGYSEAAASILSQPEGLGWSVFDARIADIARQFEDFRQAEAAGAVLRAESIDALAALARLPPSSLAATHAEVEALKHAGGTDRFGRSWAGVVPLSPPFHAVRVTGALFHTQGGLVVDHEARVVGVKGDGFPNLFAAGGAACGVSGAQASGYLSGNGLLTAVGYGYIAGEAAARQAKAATVARAPSA